MPTYAFDGQGKELQAEEERARWRVLWEPTGSGYRVQISFRRADAWSPPQTLNFEGLEFQPRDAIAAWKLLHE